MRYFRQHLQAKIIFVVVLTLLIPTILIGAYTVTVTTDELLKSANEKNLQVVRSQSAAALQYLAEGERDVLYLSQSPATRRYVGVMAGEGDQDSADYLTSQLKLFLSSTPNYGSVRILDNTGQEVFGVDNTADGPNAVAKASLINQASQLYFIEALRLAGQVYISDVNLNTLGKKIAVPYNPVVYFSLALYAEGGGVVGVITLKASASPILSTNVIQTGNEATYIVDDRGNYLANPDSSKLFGQILKTGITFNKDRPHDALLLAKQNNPTAFLSQDRPNAIQTMSRVAIPNRATGYWLFIYSESLDEVLGQINNARLVILLLAGAALIIAASFAWIITQNIVRPVRQLAKTAGLISQGEWSVRVPEVRSGDEIARLASAFDRMAKELKTIYGSLEERVIARTNELEMVAKVGAAAAAILDLSTLLKSVTDLTRTSFGLSGVSIYLVDETGVQLRLAARSSSEEQPPQPRSAVSLADLNSIVAKAGREQTGLMISNLLGAESGLKWASSAVRSEMAIPLKVANILLGVLELQSDQADRFSVEELRVMTILSDQIAVAVQNANLYKEQLLTTRELEIAQHNAEEASQAKSLFLSNMSHELRTPLNVVIGYTSSMLERPTMYDNVPLPEVYAKDIRLIKDSGFHLIGLINDILDLSKIEAGKLELQPVNTNLIDIFKGVLATSVGLVKDKPIQIKADYPDDLPIVWADDVRVRQIILNLMSNAIKFTEQGSVTLHAYAESNQVVISVIDTGIGISESALATIFDRFQQATKDTSKRYGGTGLGLDISKQLCRMHGGDLTATSVLGQGSTFTFTLPITQAPSEAIASPTGDDALSVGRVFSASNPAAADWSVMLVEDEISLINLLRRNLEASGYTVIVTSHDAAAAEMASAVLPDAIIVDIHPPEVSGWALLEVLRANAETADIPVLVCAGASDRDRALTSGAAHFLRKPIEPDAVLAALGQIRQDSQSMSIQGKH